MTPRERIERSERVRAILASPEWLQAWAAIRATYMQVIESTEDDQQALEARRMLRAANKAREHLEALVADGKMATADITARRSLLRI